MKKLLLVPLAAVLFAFSANASPIRTLTLQQSQAADKGLRADILEVHGHRSAVSIIATDALYGGIAGLAIGAGVALLSNDGNWGRDLAIGAGAGLIVGGIFGRGGRGDDGGQGVSSRPDAGRRLQPRREPVRREVLGPRRFPLLTARGSSCRAVNSARGEPFRCVSATRREQMSA
jgi:hypothetical protein